jgi:putative MATE family efflux protein
LKVGLDFTIGNITKQIIFFSLPMLAGNVLQQAYSIIDAIVVGRFIGGTAIGAVGIAMNISHFLIASIIGLTTGASVVLSQFYGAKKLEAMEKTVSTSIVFLGLLSLLIMIIGYISSPFLLRLLQTPDEIFYDALVYVRILIIGIVFPIFYNMYTAYLRALGDSKSPLKILMWTTILNIVLNLIAVILFGWGITSVAWVTIFSKAVSAVWCYQHVKKSAPLLHVNKLSFDLSLFKLIIKYGFPAAIQLSFVYLAMLSISLLIN